MIVLLYHVILLIMLNVMVLLCQLSIIDQEKDFDKVSHEYIISVFQPPQDYISSLAKVFIDFVWQGLSLD